MFIQARPLSKDWFAARAGKITASNAASILCPGTPGAYGTPLSVYTQIRRELEGQAEDEMPDDEPRDFDSDEDDEPDAERTARADLAWGNETEELHRRMLAKAAKITLEPCTGLFVDDELLWLAATPDALATDRSMPEDKQEGLAETKAPTEFGMSKFRGEDWPLAYICQTAVQMRVTKTPWDILSALIPPKPRWRRVFASSEMEEWVLEGLTAFWEGHILADIPPAATTCVADLRALKALWPTSNGKRFILPPRAVEALDQFEHGKALVKEGKKLKEAAEIVVLEEFGDSELGILPDGSAWSLKVTNATQPPREALSYSYRTPRKVKKP